MCAHHAITYQFLTSSFRYDKFREITSEMNTAANKAKSVVRSMSRSAKSVGQASKFKVNATSCNDAAAADASSGALGNSSQHRHRIDCCGHREIVTRIVKAPAFDRVITFVIILNTIALSISHEGEPQALTDALVYVNYVFTAVFFVEMVWSEGGRWGGGGRGGGGHLSVACEYTGN
jgi:hypothetical protein